MKPRNGRPEHLTPYEWDQVRGKFWANGKVATAKRNGALPVLDGSILCADCGEPATDYDHRDYNKPLDVEPTCRSCNLKRGPAKPMEAA